MLLPNSYFIKDAAELPSRIDGLYNSVWYNEGGIAFWCLHKLQLVQGRIEANRDPMKKAGLSTGVPLEWFTVEEAAQYLRASKRTIYKWSREGRLPADLIGNRRHRRYRKDDLDKVPRPADPQGNINEQPTRA